VGRVRVIFTLPKTLPPLLGARSAPSSWPTDPLAYVEWYTQTPTTPQEKDGNMFRIKSTTTPPPGSNRLHPPGAIIRVSEIRQSCMLFPIFNDENVPPDWTTSNVLDKSKSFLVNNWLSKYSYHTIW